MKKKDIAQNAATLSKLQCKGLFSSFQEDLNQNITPKFFIHYCVDNGYSVKQVLQAILYQGLVMLNAEGKRVRPMSFLSENNLEDYLYESEISFPALHADFFWRETQPDHMGGWRDQTEDNSIASSIQNDPEKYERAKHRTYPEQKLLAKTKKKEGLTNWQIAQFVFPHKINEVEKGTIKKDSLLRQVRRLLE